MAGGQRGSEATIYSVAELAGVSIASVSRVMQGSASVSERTRRKVLDAAQELDYVPLAAARSLAVRHHEAHGLVMPELNGPYYAELLVGFEMRAAELGQSVVVLLTAGKPDPARDVRRLATRVDGLVMVASSASPETVAGLRSSKPVVLVAHPQPGLEAIGAENRDSSEELTAHLIAHGCEALLFVGDPDIAPDAAERYEGFVAAHGDRPASPPVRIRFDEPAGADFADRLLAGELRADGLVCANDELALAIMGRLLDGGLRVPEDVAIAGWDDVMAARYVRPGLTTVRQPVRELGMLAADRLHERTAGGQAHEGLRLLPTQVVLRGSCGCAEDGSSGSRPTAASTQASTHASTRASPQASTRHTPPVPIPAVRPRREKRNR